MTGDDMYIEWEITGGRIETCLNMPLKILLSVLTLIMYSESRVIVPLIFNLGC